MLVLIPLSELGDKGRRIRPFITEDGGGDDLKADEPLNGGLWSPGGVVEAVDDGEGEWSVTGRK